MLTCPLEKSKEKSSIGPHEPRADSARDSRQTCCTRAWYGIRQRLAGQNTREGHAGSTSAPLGRSNAGSVISPVCICWRLPQASTQTSTALLSYLFQVRGVSAHSCHAIPAHAFSQPFIQLTVATFTLMRACCLPRPLVAGIHVALGKNRCTVKMTTKG